MGKVRKNWCRRKDLPRVVTQQYDISENENENFRKCSLFFPSMICFDENIYGSNNTKVLSFFCEGTCITMSYSKKKFSIKIKINKRGIEQGKKN